MNIFILLTNPLNRNCYIFIIETNKRSNQYRFSSLIYVCRLFIKLIYNELVKLNA